MNLVDLLLALAFLAGNSFFVAAEFALLAARRSRIDQLASDGSGAAVSAQRSLRELSLMLAGAQLGITMMTFGIGHLTEPAVVAGLEAMLGPLALPAGVSHGIAFAIAMSIVVLLHMVVGEMAPKSWAISDPEGSALLLVRPFRLFVLVFRPFIRALNLMANGVVRLCRVEPQDERAMVHNARDLRLLLNESHKHGHLGDDQRELLDRALQLSGLTASAAMVPREAIIAVPATAGVDDLERVASRTGRSRLPVHGAGLDEIRGVLHVKDLLRVTGPERDVTTAAAMARPALITSGDRPIEGLMVRMRAAQQHIALVVGKDGDVAGLVALEDLIEELIGDFEDESDPRGS